MSDLEPKEPGEYCNARKTDGSGHCKHEAGWGTDHPGVGRCKFHLGNTENHEKKVLNDLEDAAEDAAVTLRLKLKHARKRAENGEDVDFKEIDRLARTVLDRTGHGPSETREITGEDGGPLEITLNEEIIETGHDPE